MAGLPDDAKNYLLSESVLSSNDALVEDELYVVEIYERDGESFGEVRRIDLNSPDGERGFVKASLKMKLSSTMYSYFAVQEGVVLIQGVAGLVLAKSTLEILFSEESVATDKWARGGFAFIHNGLYCRRRSVLSPKNGIDVVNIQTHEIVGFLDCDIEDRTPPHNGLLYGERDNGNFALYSINEKDYCFEVNCEKYGEAKGRGLRSCLDGDFVYLLCGGYVLVIDVERKELVKEIQYASSAVLQDLIKNKNITDGLFADIFLCLTEL